MIDMIKLEDHKNPDGSYNWVAYRSARLAIGEICRKCGQFIVWAKGYPSRCNDCERIEDESDEITHDSRIRCPKCRHVSPIDDRYELYEDGDHEVSCGECGHDFEVNTYVSRSFRSPALLSEQETQD